MTKYEERFYNLGQFLGSFFHQHWKDVIDWQGQPPTFEAIVDFYKTLASPAELAKTTDELRQFLALPLPDEEFNDIVTHELGGSYTPRSRGLSKRQWLEAVLRMLEEPIPQPSALRFIG